MDELQRIVERLRKAENVDVDQLVQDVSRGKELIEFCGGKIEKAKLQIHSVLKTLTAPERPEPAVIESEPNSQSSGNDEIPF